MNDYTEIVVILDRSGSMQSAKKDHEGGLASFVHDQAELPGDVRFTLIQFDSIEPCQIVYDGAPIGDVGKIELTPRGGTPLLDAIGLSTSHVENRLKQIGARPDQVIVMIITDGEENQSREWTRERVKARVAELEKQGWSFLYLGANVDAFAEARGIGTRTSSALNFSDDDDAVLAMYAGLAQNVNKARVYTSEVKTSGGILDDVAIKACLDFSDDQRQAAKPKEGKK